MRFYNPGLPPETKDSHRPLLNLIRYSKDDPMTRVPPQKTQNHDIEKLEKDNERLRSDLAALTAEKEKLELLVDGLARAAIGIDIVTLDHRILFQNSILEERFGNGRSSLCYEKYMGLDKPCDFCPMTMAVATRKTASVQLKGRDGRDYEILSIPLVNKEGEIDRVMEIVKDITETKQTGEALKAIEENYRNLFNASVDGILVADIQDMAFVEANPAICRMLGYSRDELLTLSVRDIHPGEHLEDILEVFRKQTQGIVSVAHGVPCVTKKGEIVYADVNAAKAVILGKVCNVGIFRNITERMHLEQQLQRKQKTEAIGTLAGGIAHDFNSLLGIITGNASYALDLFNEHRDLAAILSDILKGAKQAQALTQQLLTFARGGEPIKKTIDPNQVVREAVDFVSRGLRSQCILSLDDDLRPVEADAGQIHHVLTNLLINADQSMADGGNIRVRTENTHLETSRIHGLPQGNYVKISVEDQGSGIPTRHLSNIFDPYFTTKSSGRGLGLPTADSIIRKHQGHIAVHTVPGQGSIFHVYLPESPRSAPVARPESMAVPTGRGKILVMDDQEPLLDIAGRLLASLGYDSVLARDGQEALDLFQAACENGEPFDAVILDLTVPGGMGGAQVFPLLLALDPQVRAVVSSGYSSDPIMANFRTYGFSGVVPKPYTRAQLADVLHGILGQD